MRLRDRLKEFAANTLYRLRLLPATRFSFVDVPDRAKANPYTFYCPSQTLIDQLQVGDEVKVIFEYEPAWWQAFGAERMWLEILEIERDRIRGRLVNQQSDRVSLRQGDEFVIRPENVADAVMADYPEDFGQSVEPYARGCLMSYRITQGEPVAYLGRMTPREDDGRPLPDSGWLLLAEGDDPTSLAEQGKLLTRSLGFALNRDDRWLDLIDEPVGRQYFWSSRRGRFERLAVMDRDGTAYVQYESDNPETVSREPDA